MSHFVPLKSSNVPPGFPKSIKKSYAPYTACAANCFSHIFLCPQSFLCVYNNYAHPILIVYSHILLYPYSPPHVHQIVMCPLCWTQLLIDSFSNYKIPLPFNVDSCVPPILLVYSHIPCCPESSPFSSYSSVPPLLLVYSHILMVSLQYSSWHQSYVPPMLLVYSHILLCPPVIFMPLNSCIPPILLVYSPILLCPYRPPCVHQIIMHPLYCLWILIYSWFPPVFPRSIK